MRKAKRQPTSSFNIRALILACLTLSSLSCDLGLIGAAYLYDQYHDDDDNNKLSFDVRPYRKDAHPNLDCALLYDNKSNQCSLKKLPLLAMETSTPVSADIAKRMLVSHQWMGDRFLDVLDNLSPDILELMGSVTAVVISGEIRPSFYTTETGAIYLDARYLWLSEQEKATIPNAQDFRTGFDGELQFASLWRYLRADGSWARLTNDRVLADLSFPLGRLLYHELAHAHTFFPRSSYSKLDQNDNIIDAANSVINDNIAVQLNNDSPLSSNTMKGLARVMFGGQKASGFQKSLSASNVGSAFASDRASDDYAFFSNDGQLYFEDVAVLFEELMSKHHFNHDREIAYTNSANSSFCNDYVIAWGQTGRIGDSQVKEAARQVANAILPDAGLSAVIDSLASPTQSAVPSDWCAPFLVPKGIDFRDLDSSLYDIRPNLLSPHY